MASLVGGINADGVRPLGFDDLQRLADEWRTSSAVPEGVASLLMTSRALFTHSWFVYEFTAVAVAWSLMAVEAALRQALAPASDRTTLKDLIQRAKRERRIPTSWAERLDAGRRLRNGFAHPQSQLAYTVGMAAPMLEASHEVCCLLFGNTAVP